MRGKLFRKPGYAVLAGSIPACAGEAFTCAGKASVVRVYPRVCGGSVLELKLNLIAVGLSPRVRGKRGRYRR